MDRLIARRLERDDDFRARITKLAKDYARLGEDSLNFYSPIYDAAHDVFQGYARLTQKDLDNLDRGHPRNYILPIAATQIITMATSISHALFGETRLHRVDGRGPEDQDAADLMNQLLMWNDEKVGIYQLGYLWVLDSLLYNKGIFYESYEPEWKTAFDRVMVDDPEDLEEVPVMKKIPAPPGPDGQPQLDEEGQPTMIDSEEPVLDEQGVPVFHWKARQFPRWVKRKEKIGGYNRLYLVGPYDFICDPIFPFYRLQEMRFCGHRKMISWLELDQRCRLSVDDDLYVDPKSVEAVKRGSNSGVGASSITNTTTSAESRTAFERTKYAMTPLGITADQKDGGIIEVYELWVKLIPADYDIEEVYEPTLYRILIANKEYILSLEMGRYAHDEFPYAVGEARPSGHYQNSPSWMVQLLPLQHHIDYLKNRHQEALANTVGNIFIAKLNKVNIEDFLDPDKEGKIISILPEAQGEPIDDIIKQVQIQDLTKNFDVEAMRFVDIGNLVSGATQQMQGKPDSDASATGEQMAVDMGKNRMASIARLLSVGALTKQTARQVSNFQQFQTEDMWVRIRGPQMSLPKELIGQKSVKISRDTIQGAFDFVPHDGSLPGLDQRQVAAGMKLVEAGSTFPVVFGGKPGDLDLRKLLYTLAKKSGLPVETFIVPYGAPPPDDGGGAGGPAPAGPPGPDGGAPPPPGAGGIAPPPGPVAGSGVPSDVSGLPLLDGFGANSLAPSQPRPQSA